MYYETCALPDEEVLKFIKFYKKIVKKDFCLIGCDPWVDGFFGSSVRCFDIDCSNLIEIKIWERDFEKAQKMAKKCEDEVKICSSFQPA